MTMSDLKDCDVEYSAISVQVLWEKYKSAIDSARDLIKSMYDISLHGITCNKCVFFFLRDFMLTMTMRDLKECDVEYSAISVQVLW